MKARRKMSLSSVSVWISLSSSSRSTSITSVETVAEIRPRKRPPDRIERSPVNMPGVNFGIDAVEVCSAVTASSCPERTTKIFVTGWPGSPTTSPCVSRRRRPCGSMRASCAGVSSGNASFVRESVWSWEGRGAVEVAIGFRSQNVATLGRDPINTEVSERRTTEAEPRGHFHQVGERVGLHLLHDLAAVRFYRDFADAELATDLLVQPARDHQVHDLPFATGEGRVTVSDGPYLRLAIQGRAAALDGLPDGAQEHVVPEWLRQELDGSRLHGPHRHGHVAMARDEDDRHMG